MIKHAVTFQCCQFVNVIDIQVTLLTQTKFTDWYIRWNNKVRELIAVKLLHTSLLNTTVVTFKVLPLGSYAPMPASSPLVL